MGQDRNRIFGREELLKIRKANLSEGPASKVLERAMTNDKVKSVIAKITDHEEEGSVMDIFNRAMLLKRK